MEVKRAGGAAMILMNPELAGITITASVFVLPTSQVSYFTGKDLKAYIIQNGLMTSAKQMNIQQNPILDERLQPADVFAIGAGHVNPARALDPGFIYDIKPDEHIPSLCGLGFTEKQLATVAHKPVKCSGSIPEGELNCPSFSVTLGPPQTFTRTVTNVGTGNSSYVAMVVPPQGVDITVKPAILSFSKLNQKVMYSVIFSRANSTAETGSYSHGYLRWDSEKYSVRSPISVKFK